MHSAADNLKAVLEHFSISKNGLAQAVGVDPSLVSRWVSGERNLKASSPQMDALTEYVLERCQEATDYEWLNQQFVVAGLTIDASSVYNTKQNLVIWLAADGEALLRALSSTGPVTHSSPPLSSGFNSPPILEQAALIGTTAIAVEIRQLLRELPGNSQVDIFCSNDRITTLIDPSVAQVIQDITSQNSLRIRLLVCVSNTTEAMSKLIDMYMPALVSGQIDLSLMYGITQTVTNQIHMIFSDRSAMLITETPGVAAPPVATVVKDESFVLNISNSFDTTIRYAQPALKIYGDGYTRDIIEILYLEFCTPGALDVVKDSINPMFMSTEAYDRLLQTRGHSPEEYAWRSSEFIRFRTGMIDVLSQGEVFREVLSLARLNDIVKNGYCRLPGLYFMETGYLDIDANSCREIMLGYVAALENIPNFQLLILDDLCTLHKNNCWQLKRDKHVAINYWSGPQPVMTYSDQPTLVHEFQNHFDNMWAQGSSHIGQRSKVISTLNSIAERLKTRHKNCD